MFSILNKPVTTIKKVSREGLDLGPVSTEKFFLLNNGRNVRDKHTLFREFAERANFGGHFGYNWDALIDCLTEPDYPGVAFVIFVFYHYVDFQCAAEADFHMFLNVFEDADVRSRYELGQYQLVLLLVEE